MLASRGFGLSIVLALAGCGLSSSADDEMIASEAPLLSDVVSITDDGAGTFTVACRDGRREFNVPAARIQAGDVCTRRPDEDLFDPKICDLPALTPDEARALAGFDVASGKTSHRLGKMRYAMRIRTCTDDPTRDLATDTCGGWSTVKPTTLIAFGEVDEPTGGPCPFQQRAPELCGPRQTTKRKVAQPFALEPAHVDALLGGDLILKLVANQPRVRLDGNAATALGTYAFGETGVFEGRLGLGHDDSAAPSKHVFRRATVAPDAIELDPFLEHFVVHADRAPLTGKVTRSCARYTTTRLVPLRDGVRNTYFRETELVLFSRY